MKKTFFYLVLAVTTIFFTACDKNNDQNDDNNGQNGQNDQNDQNGNTKNYSVGDYYKVSGVEGIVFEISENGKHGKIISMDETQAAWATTETWTVLTNAIDENDGLVNTNIIKNNFDINEYPAFKWCIDKNSGGVTKWYFPAKNELLTIYSVFDKLQNALDKHQGTLLNNTWFYWSSSEYPGIYPVVSWYVNFSTGGASYLNTFKYDYRGYVRAVRSF